MDWEGWVWAQHSHIQYAPGGAPLLSAPRALSGEEWGGCAAWEAQGCISITQFGG